MGEIESSSNVFDDEFLFDWKKWMLQTNDVDSLFCIISLMKSGVYLKESM